MARRLPARIVDLVNRPWDKAVVHLQDIINAILDWLNDSWGGVQATKKEITTFIINNPDSTFDLEGTTGDNLAKLTVGGSIAPAFPLTSANEVSLDNTKHFLTVKGTLPASPSVSSQGIFLNITTAGSSANGPFGVYEQFNPGYTGTGVATAFYIENGAASTGTFPGAGNFAIQASSYGTTTGHNVGLQGAALNGNLNLGVYSLATTAKNNATNVGVFGVGRNTGTTPIQVGGYFGLNSFTPLPTFASAALIADNSDQTSPIARFRNNGVDQVLVGDGVPNNNSQHFLEVVGTLPASPSATVEGVVVNVTSAGSSANFQNASSFYLGAGYTGSGNATTIYADNAAAGTGNNLIGNLGNFAVSTFVGGTTTGANVSLFGWAQGGNLNVGAAARAIDAKNSATNIGVAGFGRNTGTTPVEIGGYFGLNTSNPTFTSAALVADNAATTNPIARFRNNGVDQVLIGDGVPNDNSQHFLEVVGTLPSSPSGFTNGIELNVTSAGSASFNQDALDLYLNAGYTGSSTTTTFYAENAVAGTASGALLGNFAGYFISYGTTTGNKYGLYGEAQDGNLNIGVQGITRIAKNSATNIGVVGFGRNTGTSPIEIGGYFGLHTSNPTFTSAALVADNAATTNPIARFRNNGVDQVVIGDGIVSGVTDNLLHITGTFPASPASSPAAIDINLTTAGSSGTAAPYGLSLVMNPGYTGSLYGIAQYIENGAQGTANSVVGALGNTGLYSTVYNTTTGANLGNIGVVSGGNVNTGTLGIAISAKNGATNIGGAFFGRNTGTTPVQVGVYAGLNSSNPTFTSAALVADNAATTDPIARFRNNGVDQVLVGDGVPNDNSQHFLEVVGTLPASPSAGVQGILATITSAGSAAQTQEGLIVNLNSGYTGSAFTSAGGFINNAAATGTDILSAGNGGLYGTSSQTTVGTNSGLFGAAGSGNINIGVVGVAVQLKNSATNVAVLGLGRNTGTTPIEVGGHFELRSSGNPTFASSALTADNGSVSAPIFRGRDNGTDVWTIQDGGHVYAKMSTKALTEASATAFVRIAVAQSTSVAGVVKYQIQANDATDFQSRSGELHFTAVNKAGTETVTLSTPGAETEVFAESAGGSTLTNTFDTATGTDTFDIRANATSSLTQTTLRINYTVEMWSNAVTTVTPQ